MWQSAHLADSALLVTWSVDAVTPASTAPGKPDSVSLGVRVCRTRRSASHLREVSVKGNNLLKVANKMVSQEQ